MNKKFYFIMIFIFALSALLLGLSYSKDSGKDMELKIKENVDEYFRVVYSTEQTLSSNNDSIDFGITNISDKNVDYVIRLHKKTNKNVYYTLDGEEEKTLNNDKIFTSSLSKKGTDGDYEMHTISVSGDEGFKVRVDVVLLDNSLGTVIKDSSQVFVDDDNDYRFFGGDVLNYIKSDKDVYRIVGLIDGKIKIVSECDRSAIYDANSEFLTEEDYLLSFDDHKVDVNNLSKYKSWLNNDYRYWLESDDDDLKKVVDADVGVIKDPGSKRHYRRYVKYIPADAVVTSGVGSLSDPYEVSYGS